MPGRKSQAKASVRQLRAFMGNGFSCGDGYPQQALLLGILLEALFAFVEIELHGAFLFYKLFLQYGGNAFVIAHDFNGGL